MTKSLHNPRINHSHSGPERYGKAQAKKPLDEFAARWLKTNHEPKRHLAIVEPAGFVAEFGERHSECRNYSSCLNDFLAKTKPGRGVNGRCPVACAGRTDVSRSERLNEAMAAGHSARWATP